MEKSFFVLYDIQDNIIMYFDNLQEFLVKYNYPLKEINRKFKKTNSNYINVDIDNFRYKLFCFN